jgi:tRNA dimethylallyltransferase
VGPEAFADALILTGPTGSGKTRLSLELARRLGAEIVSMDSMALYRGLDVLSAKPTAEERARVRHHLVDVLDPWQPASVAWWLEQAARACADIRGRGRQVLFVGGTPLYLKALLHGLFDGPGADPAVRRRLEDEAAAQGGAALHARLATVDPEAAARLHPNDVRRLVRALEVWETTGRPISDWQQQWACPAAGGPDRCLWLDRPRAELYARIDARVDAMVAEGLVEEVSRLRQLPRPLGREAAQAVGVHEIGYFLDGKMSLDDAVRQIQQRSRRFAKRQLTWFRALACRPVSEQLTFVLWQSRMGTGEHESQRDTSAGPAAVL